MQTTFNAVYTRLENRLDPSVDRFYQAKLPVCKDDMFGAFLLSDSPKELVDLTPENQLLFHMRVAVLSLVGVNIIHNRENTRVYNLPDVNWHLSSIDKYYQQSLNRWIYWTQETAGNYNWMRKVLFIMNDELDKSKLNPNDSTLKLISDTVAMVKKYKGVSANPELELTRFPTNVRVSRAKLIANRWPYAQYKKPPEWWPYPSTMFKQEYFVAIDKVKRKLVTLGDVLVLDQVPDIAFTPPPINILTSSKRATWDEYNWKKFVKAKGDWHQVYDYDPHWLQRLIK